jgi:hypothetical protein
MIEAIISHDMFPHILEAFQVMQKGIKESSVSDETKMKVQEDLLRYAMIRLMFLYKKSVPCSHVESLNKIDTILNGVRVAFDYDEI